MPFGLPLFLFIVVMYFLPSIIAAVCKRRQAMAISMVNLFLGWTVLGWFIAFIWALITPAPPVVVYQQAPTPPDTRWGAPR